MQLRKVTESKYIGNNNINVRQMRDGRFSIFLGSKITRWGIGFQTLRSAETFLNNHDYIYATIDTIPLSADDIEFAMNMYGFESDDGMFNNGSYSASVEEENGQLVVIISPLRGRGQVTLRDADELFSYLDQIVPESSVFSSVIFRGNELRQLFAARGRSSREITKNLVRVKSSNLWAYGVEIKDNKSKVGDVYIQFKGKNGGPTGGLYRYYDVPISLWRKFLGYPSKGAFFWKYIRNNFLYSKLDGDKRGKLPNAVN